MVLFPDPRQRLVRYYGAYANRARRLFRLAEEEQGGGPGRRSATRMRWRIRNRSSEARVVRAGRA
jgi:hypothetical protein